MLYKDRLQKGDQVATKRCEDTVALSQPVPDATWRIPAYNPSEGAVPTLNLKP